MPIPKLIPPSTPSRLEQYIWWKNAQSPNRWQRTLRVVSTVLHGAWNDMIWMRAGNMTYLSLLYLVPLGALALSLSNYMGWKVILVNWILRRLSTTAPELAANIVDAMERLDLIALGFVGFAAVFIASVIAISELEEDLSEIWNAKGLRAWWQRILLYPVAIAIVPMVMATLLVFGTIAEARAEVWIGALSSWGVIGEFLHTLLTTLPLVFQLVPYVLTWLLLTLLYYTVTSAPIRLRAAAIGGISAGIVSQLAQRTYINFQFATATYQEFWGYLAQIPLLILWIYVSWIILYLGAELVFAWQYREGFMPKWPHLLSRTITMEEGALDRLHRAMCGQDEESPNVLMATMSTRLLVPLPLLEFISRRLAMLGIFRQQRTRKGFRYQITAKGRKLDKSNLFRIYRQEPEPIPSLMPGSSEDGPVE